MIKVLLFGLDFGDSSPLSNLHLGYIARKYKNEIKEFGVDVITANILSNADINFEAGMTIHDVLKKLPSGWEPDFILIQGPEYIFLPRKLYESEYPVVFITCDYDYDILRAYHFFKIADFVVCFSDVSKKDIEKLGARRVEKFPIWIPFGFKLEREKIKHIRERKNDIFYSGNFVPDKARLIDEIIKLSKKMKCEIHRGYIPTQKYIQKLIDSKLSITYHRRREIQRPEFILCGGILITNSPEFKEVFRENEDFFLYKSFEDIEDAVERANDYINSENYNHEERVDRILSLYDFFNPPFRFSEIVKFVNKNIGKSSVSERDFGEDWFVADVLANFQLVDVYSLPRSIKEAVLLLVRKIVEEIESNFVFPEHGFITEVFLSYKTTIDFMLQKRYEMQLKENYIAFLNSAFLEISRFNYPASIEYLKKAKDIISRREIDPNYSKYINLIPSVVPYEAFYYFYFPEYRDIFREFISNGIINKEAILSYINFLLGCIIRDISLPKETGLKDSLTFFDEALEVIRGLKDGVSSRITPRFKIEKAKALVKLGDFDSAFRECKEYLSIEDIEFFLPLFISQREINQDVISYLKMFLAGFKEVKHKNSKPTSCSIFLLDDSIASLSTFMQNVLWNIYPYAKIYALTTSGEIRGRILKSFPKVGVAERIEEIAEKEKDTEVFTLAPGSVLLKRSKIFFDSVLLPSFNLSCLISKTEGKKSYLISLSKDVFYELLERREISLQDFAVWSIPYGINLFDMKPSFEVEEEGSKLKVKLI